MKKTNMSFDDEEISNVEIIHQSNKTITQPNMNGATTKPLVSQSDSMLDIHNKLKKASKNERDAIYASAREQDFLKKMEPVEDLRQKHSDSYPVIRAGKDRVNLLARRVRAINSDGDTIEIDMVSVKDENRKKYLREIGKLPSEESEIIQKKKKLKETLEFDD